MQARFVAWYIHDSHGAARLPRSNRRSAIRNLQSLLLALTSHFSLLTWLLYEAAVIASGYNFAMLGIENPIALSSATSAERFWRSVNIRAV